MGEYVGDSPPPPPPAPFSPRRGDATPSSSRTLSFHAGRSAAALRRRRRAFRFPRRRRGVREGGGRSLGSGRLARGSPHCVACVSSFRKYTARWLPAGARCSLHPSGYGSSARSGTSCERGSTHLARAPPDDA